MDDDALRRCLLLAMLHGESRNMLCSQQCKCRLVGLEDIAHCLVSNIVGGVLDPYVPYAEFLSVEPEVSQFLLILRNAISLGRGEALIVCPARRVEPLIENPTLLRGGMNANLSSAVG